MRATLIHAARDIRVEDVPDPAVQRPTDALVRVTAACVCGSDLWPYRGVVETSEPHRIGHEFVGVVEDVGADVSTLSVGDFVIAPFALSDGTCAHCRNGVQTSCVHGAWWGGEDEEGLPIDGGQGQAVRVPMADGTLVAVPGLGDGPDDKLLAGLLTLSDVMGTGHHAARCGRSGQRAPPSSWSATGPSASAPSSRLVASARTASSPCPGTPTGRRWRATSARPTSSRRGATTVSPPSRSCSVASAPTRRWSAWAPRSRCSRRSTPPVPAVGSGTSVCPAGGSELPIRKLFSSNVSVGGGVAPVRAYIPELLEDVLSGAIDPGRVFDLVLPLDAGAGGLRGHGRAPVDQDDAATLTSAGELAVQRGQHRAGHGVGVVAADHC